MVIKVLMLIIFFAVMIGIGFYCRKNSTDVNGFVLGGRSVGPWLTAFAYGTSYFWISPGLGHSGQKNPYHDSASGFRHHAPVL